MTQIDTGTLLLPEFQRGYVWNRDQVRGLMWSLYRGHPVGGLLLWETDVDDAAVRGGVQGSGSRLLLLDGQQRVTTLYGVIRGEAPAFFEGNAAAFTGLCFNVQDERFEFYAPSKMTGDPDWIRLTDLYRDGLAPYVKELFRRGGDIDLYVGRLNSLLQISDREFHEEKITGKDKTIDVVVDIFNRVNSGGTHLSKGDLALATICARWPAARKAMRDQLDQWKHAGYDFSLDWLLRNATAVAKGRSVFTALHNMPAAEFEVALKAVGQYVGAFLDAASSRLGFASLERWRGGNLTIAQHDFDGSTTGSRFYPLLYLLTRVKGARDLGSGLRLWAQMLGKNCSLQVHHIFPKAQLYKAGYDRSLVNAIANFCFLTQDTNLAIGKRLPTDYFAEAERKHPGALASQWIPTDPALWELDRYEDFLAARRELLAGAAESFLSELRSGTTAGDPVRLQPVELLAATDDDPRSAQVRSLVAALMELGCAAPELDSAIADPTTGRELAVAEAFLPAGLQLGQGSPVVLELDPNAADLPRLEELGFEVFTSVDALLGFATRRNEAAAGDAPATPAVTTTGRKVTVEAEFERAMRSVYDRAKREAGYNATYFLSMLADLGGLATAKKLVNAPAISDGFAKLWERGRLDLTVEALVVQPRFADLFTEDEVDAARRRLDQFSGR